MKLYFLLSISIIYLLSDCEYANSQSDKLPTFESEKITKQLEKASYQIIDEKYHYMYEWNNTDARKSPDISDGSSRLQNKPWMFNWCCRTDPMMLISGDLPRIALARRFKMASLTPPIISLGDLRIRISIGNNSFYLDEETNIKTEYFPWGTIHNVSLSPKFPIKITVKAISIKNIGMGIEIVPTTSSDESIEADIDVIYGGLSNKGNLQQKTVYIEPSDDDSKSNIITKLKNLYEISAPDIASKVIISANPQTESFVSTIDSANIQPNRIVFKYHLSIDKKSGPINLIVQEKRDGQYLELNDFNKHINDSIMYFDSLIKNYSIETPDAILNSAFFASIINMDYLFEDPIWLEGVHCWSAPLNNNYQISAAISLKQFDKAKKALRYFANLPDGPCPPRLTDGTPMPDPRFGFEEGIPYFILQLYSYWQATGDNELLNDIWKSLVINFEKYWTIRDPDANLLLNYHEGSNCFLYQADHLSLPGDAVSPSIIMSDCLEKMANLAESMGEINQATAWRNRARYMIDEIISKLWSESSGKFISTIDEQGYKMEANYYTDFVFPVLYSKIPIEYSWLSMKALDKILKINDNLMRVGNLKPSLFGNDNVMPVQMSEAAEAYFKIGRFDEGYKFLNSVAYGSTVYTDSPGNFPERMSDTGFGLSDYVFGNPTGAFIKSLIGGLFGLEQSNNNRPIIWHPAIPEVWKKSSIKIEDINVSISGIHGDRTFSISLPEKQQIEFSTFMHGHRVIKVTDQNGNKIPYKLTNHPNGAIIHISASESNKYIFHIISEKDKSIFQLPQKINSKNTYSVDLPNTGYSVLDPQKLLSTFNINNSVFDFKINDFNDKRTFFLKNDILNHFIPFEINNGKNIKKVIENKKIAGNRKSIDLNNLYNSDNIRSRNMWRFAPVNIDFSKIIDSQNAIKINDSSFTVKSSGKNIALIEIGDLHNYTNAHMLSDKPQQIRFDINDFIEGIEFLMIAEWKVRLTGMKVGELKFCYTDGSEYVIPIVNGENTGSLNAREAKSIDYYELEWLKNLYIMQVKSKYEKKLNHIDVSVIVPDGSLGILAANIIFKNRTIDEKQ